MKKIASSELKPMTDEQAEEMINALKPILKKKWKISVCHRGTGEKVAVCLALKDGTEYITNNAE